MGLGEEAGPFSTHTRTRGKVWLSTFQLKCTRAFCKLAHPDAIVRIGTSHLSSFFFPLLSVVARAG